MEKQELKIKAKEPYSSDYIEVKQGEVYSFSAKGVWVDLIIPCSPNGWKIQKIFGKVPRLLGVPYFMLCGNYNKDEKSNFKIGKSLSDYKILVDGKLYFFANDLMNKYANNWGSINITAVKQQ